MSEAFGRGWEVARGKETLVGQIWEGIAEET